jgi:DNA-3-methyladenine glycosylase II
MFVLSVRNKSIKHLCKVDDNLKSVIKKVGPITYVPYDNGFCFLAESIIGQMLSNKVADVISTRFENLCNNQINPATVREFEVSDLRNIGISNKKSEYIISLAKQIGDINLDLKILESKTDNEVLKFLTSFKGIGQWTAKMYLIFVLNRPDVLPNEDTAFVHSFKWLYNLSDIDESYVIRKCEPWRPYRSIGARYLYKALDLGLTRKI